MKVKQTKKIILFILIILCILIINKSVFAINTDYYKPSTLRYNEGKTLFNKVAPVIKFISDVGIIGAVLALTIIGLKFMLGSTSEEKAKIKQMILPLICGCLLIVGTSTLVRTIALISNENSQTTTTNTKQKCKQCGEIFTVTKPKEICPFCGTEMTLN